MQIQHPQLIDLFKKAYSAEKAAAFAYQDRQSFNNVDLDKKYPVEESGDYCRK